MLSKFLFERTLEFMRTLKQAYTDTRVYEQRKSTSAAVSTFEVIAASPAKSCDFSVFISVELLRRYNKNATEISNL